ncbi:MAG TPA: RDD family protein [Tepidisphaeraceae bacterium]|jgi:uncharacterized RDD family membrane protein YckC|nr:RDD family protein [Tepidisphaeraceae bacterium]
MKRAARNLLVLLFLVLLASPALAQTLPTTTAATTAAAAGSVAATGSADGFWLAVGKPTGSATTPIESTIYKRTFGQERFSVVARIPERVVALSRWTDRAILLADDGDWIAVWPGGSGGGTPLPAGGRILAIGAEAQSVWAVGTVPGGIDSARAATRPTTGPRAATTTTTITAPSTGPAAAATGPATQPATTGSAVVLFRLDGAIWRPIVQLPTQPPLDLINGAEILPLADRVIVSVTSSPGNSTLFTINPANGQVTSTTPIDGGPLAFFGGVQGEHRAWIWTGDGSASRIVPVDNFTNTLATTTAVPASQSSTVASALGTLRTINVAADGKVTEQRLTWDGQPVGEPQPVRLLAPPDEEPAWFSIVNIGVVVMLAVTIMASYRQRDVVRETMARRDRPRAAKFWIRMSAATVDALPLIIGGVVYYLRRQPDEIVSPTLAATAQGLIGIAVYLLHTTISELIFRRTLGKAIFGLAVVDLQGVRPTVSAILVRNVLRIVDIALLAPFLLPILLVVFSPLGQRAGDAAAGTVVIDLRTPTMADEPDEDNA